MTIALQLLAAAQDQTPQAPQTQNPSGDSSRTTPAVALSGIVGMGGDVAAEDTVGSLPQIPTLLGGAGFSTLSLSEMGRSNYLRGGINVGAAYDDNPLLLPTSGSNTTETVFPNIKIDESTSRMHWALGYAGGLTVNQKFTSQNQGSHNVNFDSQFRLSPHVNLRVAETFSVTTGVFDTGNGTEVGVGSGGPNASLITPLATQRSSNTTVETNYHFALNDLVGASGSFFDNHFTNVTGGAQLANTQTAAGSGFWLHQFFRGDWGGAAYRFERITFNPGSGETRVHSFFVVDTLSFSKRFTLSGFVGPQYTENQGLFPGALTSAQSKDWSVSGGAEFGWKNLNTSASAGYSRTISDGGGVLGAVRLQMVHGTFRRQLTPGWAFGLSGSYGKNRSLTVPFTGTASSIDLTSAGVSLERNLGRSFGLRFGYTHDFQQQFGLPAPTPTLDAHRNRVFVTLSYQWAKPLGI